MIQIIFLLIFVVSLLVVISILYKKMPVLAELPQNGDHGIKKPEFIVRIEKQIIEKHFHFFKKQMILHKLLSKLRIITLKVEKRIDICCQLGYFHAELGQKLTKDREQFIGVPINESLGIHPEVF